MSRGFRLEAVLFVRDMRADPQAASPGRHLMLSVFDFDMWLDVRSWHLADIDADGEHVRFRGQSGHL